MRFTVALVVAFASIAGAQQPIPVRTVAIDVTTDSGLFQAVSAVRHLPDGRVLVNDPRRRQLTMLSADFRSFSILAGATPGAPKRYPESLAGLITYRGDSSLLVASNSDVIFVIGPTGTFERHFTPPNTFHIPNLAAPFCACGVDPKGRLIYRTLGGGSPGSGGVMADGANRPGILSSSGVALIVRADLEKRSVETIATMQIQVQRTYAISPRRGSITNKMMVNPLPTSDEWALLPDGTIAIVRAKDYHVDWVSPEGKRTSSPKMPFEWKQITLQEKERLLDSAKQAGIAREASQPADERSPLPFMTVEPRDIADSYPPFNRGQVRADADGNVWILPTSGSGWDVVSRAGVITERVTLPAGRSLAGFGPGGVVYMIHAPTPERVLLERATVVR